MIKLMPVNAFFLTFIFLLVQREVLRAQDPDDLMKKLRAKMEMIRDYEAEARFKTEISFLKVPDAIVKIYYKKPDKIKIKNQNGISLVPKETVGISLYSLVNSPCQVLSAGNGMVQGTPVQILKLLPTDENGELVLATLYIDIRRLLVLRAKTTTRENGTQNVELFYGRFLQNGLPDKIIFSFNTGDFKLPKGVTFDYDDGSAKKKTQDPSKNQRG